MQGELMEGDNAYHVEHLGKRVAAVKRTAIKQLPQMLCIHLKRFEFDYHNQTRYKVTWFLSRGAGGVFQWRSWGFAVQIRSLQGDSRATNSAAVCAPLSLPQQPEDGCVVLGAVLKAHLLVLHAVPACAGP